MTAIKKRSEIETAYQWNLGTMYQSNEEWERDYQKAQEMFPQVEAFKGRLGESSATLLAALRLQDEIAQVLENVYVYANMNSHTDTANSANQALADRSNTLMAKAMSSLSFYKPEILELPAETLEQFLKENEDLRVYGTFLQRLMDEKEHVLSPELEDLLARTSELADAPDTIFSMLTNADLEFGTVEDSQGNEHAVSEGMYRLLLENRDRVLRENAFKRLFGTYGKFRNTLSAAYSANVKKDVFYAQAKKYNSSLEMSLFPDNVPTDVYNNLIAAVHENLDTMHRYVALRKKVLKVDDLHYYDLFVPMVENVEMSVTYEEAKEKSLTALAPLGDEYVSVVKRSFDENWIDVYPNQGKRSGAYSWGSYSSSPFILMNYNDSLDSLFTLVHELGHSVHSYYSHKDQPYVYGNYTIFVAEVASTLNENLLLEKLLAETTDKQQRMYLLNHSLDQFRSTMFRQTMFAEFEKICHATIEEGGALTADVLREIYGDLNKKYYGPDLVIDDELHNEWSRIPHFYNSFYVYKYATGFAAAIALGRQIMGEGAPAVERYLNFLSGGSSKDPLDLLKGAGVDMSSPQPIHDALQVFKERLAELEQLMLEA
ncbi:oligoendopeptidase F [Tumebacillus sp. DT12]|uniref:Oligopeptidase F n=1 Tax=Tumebacillus lacus TaxID=2995335 RepID=A0ABT3X1X1_9BACL|nr:oligoendopeptidase F [Tumebacillus lacus]MCX7569782.1 oligoendopeptidase F [Tumebacillus lacus]